MFIDLNVTKVVTYMIMYVQHEVGHTVLIVGFVQLEVGHTVLITVLHI